MKSKGRRMEPKLILTSPPVSRVGGTCLVSLNRFLIFVRSWTFSTFFKVYLECSALCNYEFYSMVFSATPVSTSWFQSYNQWLEQFLGLLWLFSNILLWLHFLNILVRIVLFQDFNSCVEFSFMKGRYCYFSRPNFIFMWLLNRFTVLICSSIRREFYFLISILESWSGHSFAFNRYQYGIGTVYV